MKIQIPTPCQENWEAMHPRENDRYCDTCCKTVVDFTSMSPDAISAYLVQHQSQKICGRFTKKQLTVEYADIYAATTHIAGSGWSSMKKIVAVFVLLFALSQAGNAQTPPKDTQSVIIVTSDAKRPPKTTANADPFTNAVPQLPAPPAQCIEVRLGGLAITPQKKQTKRKLKRLQKQEARKKQEALDQLAGEVVVVAGMVQTD
ncbi:hypothetical protein LQ567_04650 [Niabella pedocola]|uniref:HMA domain-containing protein n=1 Tax=Niabella pedocola TaxID=1752077 RepID=A0ABS8PLQ7_9BACT|nr:hypothetical protein [Niabella pedocola]MCD2422039.1 hypothetical protein [Niabella pedocola]